MFRKLRTCGTKSNRSDGSGGTNSGTSSNNSSTTGIGTIRGRSNNGSIMDKTYHTTPFTSNTNADKLLKSKQNYDGSYNSRAYDCHYHRHLGGVPISICIMILICYVTLGAALFHRLQSWNVLESLYFCFSSLGTIGFGELEPKGYIAQYVASGYILVGMALVAMCFSLIRAELSAWMYRTNDSHSSDEKLNAMPNVISHVPHHNHMMHQITNSDDVALVTVAVTPKSWLRPSDHLANPSIISNASTFNSLPRRSSAFQRNTPARRSAGPLESHIEYFVPRSISEFNLAGVGDVAIPIQMQQPQKRLPPTSILRWVKYIARAFARRLHSTLIWKKWILQIFSENILAQLER